MVSGNQCVTYNSKIFFQFYTINANLAQKKNSNLGYERC